MSVQLFCDYKSVASETGLLTKDTARSDATETNREASG